MMGQIGTGTKERVENRFAFSIDPECPLHEGKPAWTWPGGWAWLGGTPGMDVSIVFSKADGELWEEATGAAKEFMDVLLEIVCRHRYLKLQKKLEANLKHIPEKALKTEYMKAYEDITHEMYRLSKYIDFSKLPKEEIPPEAREAVEEANAPSTEKFGELLQEYIKKHHRATSATDAASDKGQPKGSGQDGELVDMLQDAKDILDRIEGLLPPAAVQPDV